jgi:pSer/pThr/pTyr-binding forkhead associated (FHA) protein
MAGDSTANSRSSSRSAGAAAPVLVPLGVLAGRPDIPLDRPVTTIGSSEVSRLRLVSRTVSRSHALLVNNNGVIYVADLASRTGVIVNGKVVHDCELKTDDELQIGKFLFRYRSPTRIKPTASVPAPPPAVVIVVGLPAIAIPGRISLIGRRDISLVPLENDQAVSAAHAVVFQMSGEWYIRDLASRTGTIVNDRPIHQQALQFGDRIQIGASTILFQPAKAETAVEETAQEEEAPAAELSDDVSPALETPVLSDDSELIPLADETPAPSQPQSVAAEKAVEDALPLEQEIPPEPVAEEIVTKSASEPAEIAEIVPADEPIALAVEPAIESLEISRDTLPEVKPEMPVAETTFVPPLSSVTSEDNRPGASAEAKSGDKDAENPSESPTESPAVESEIERAKPDDFVFVPASEPVDPKTVPEVIFWGDPELDSAAEQAVIAATAHHAAPRSAPPEQIAPTSESATPVATEPDKAEETLPAMPDFLDTAEEVSLAESSDELDSSELDSSELDSSELDSGDLASSDETLPLDMDNPFAEADLEKMPEAPSAIDTASESADDEFWKSMSVEESEECPAITSMEPSAATDAGHAVVNEFIPGDTAAIAEEDASEHIESPDKSSALGGSSTEAADDEIAVGLDLIEDGSEEEFGTVDDLLLAEPPTEPQPVAEISRPAEEAKDDKLDDLDLLDFAEPDEHPKSDEHAKSHEHPEPAQQPPAAPRSGPTIFGLDFEGASVMGGMPLKLQSPPPPAKPVTVFDATSNTRAGLGDLASTAPAAPPAQPPIEPTLPVSKRPITPPRPAKNPIAPPAPPALTGLVSDSRDTWGSTPEIPPTPRQAARAAVAAPATPTTSAFNAPGAKPRTLDVFSQMTAPIGIEVFGGRSGNPANIQLPEAKDNRAIDKNPDNRNPAPPPGTTLPVAAIPMRRPGSKIPLLLILMVLLPAAVFAVVFRFVPIAAKVVGTLDFAGQDRLPAQDARIFMVEQKKRLMSEEIRSTARALLTTDGIDPGPTDDPISYNRAVESPAAIGWSGKTLQFEYATSDPKAGPKQIAAILEALRLKDKDLDDTRARAQLAVEDADAQRMHIKTQADLLAEQRRAQSVLAQDRPSKAVIDQLDAEATRLNQRWSDSKTIRQASASVLDELRKQDPRKAVDVDADPEVVDLRKQLAPLNDQIAKLKQASSTATPAVADASGNGAATQPADADPLLTLLQQQANQLSLKLDHRQAELKADAALTPAQRQANLQSAIENMSIKLTALEHEEADDKTSAEQATAAADAAHRKLDAARLADARVDDLLQKEEAAKKDLQDAVANENDKQAALDACVTVVRDAKPQTSITETSDPRMAFSLLGSGVLVALLVWAIIAEASRPGMGSSMSAAQAAPRQRPIPWPQPHQLQTLESGKEPEPGAS